MIVPPPETKPLTTKTRRATALPPDERRSMIVAATLPLLLEHGDRVTSRQIAEAAGIAEGTIFRVFADKDEIIVAVIEAALDPEPLEVALSEIPAGLTFEARLAAAVVIIQQRVIDVWQVMSSVGTRYHEMTSRPMADSDALVRLFESARCEITVEPMAAARLLRALTLSTTHPMLAGEPRSPEELVQLFLHGIGGAVVDAAADGSEPSC
ncbi:MAG: transcriptional regulator, TetR family [Actinomycetia bacterium]|jgi:AcrR family transcriptional regulator|nr:transcriptional regulator, TetR family [Actinomycetes bacterium]